MALADYSAVPSCNSASRRLLLRALLLELEDRLVAGDRDIAVDRGAPRHRDAAVR